MYINRRPVQRTLTFIEDERRGHKLVHLFTPQIGKQGFTREYVIINLTVGSRNMWHDLLCYKYFWFTVMVKFERCEEPLVNEQHLSKSCKSWCPLCLRFVGWVKSSGWTTKWLMITSIYIIKKVCMHYCSSCIATAIIPTYLVGHSRGHNILMNFLILNMSVYQDNIVFWLYICPSLDRIPASANRNNLL